MTSITKNPRQKWLEFEGELWQGILSFKYELKSYCWQKVAYPTADGAEFIQDKADYKIRTYEFRIKSS